MQANNDDDDGDDSMSMPRAAPAAGVLENRRKSRLFTDSLFVCSHSNCDRLNNALSFPPFQPFAKVLMSVIMGRPVRK